MEPLYRLISGSAGAMHRCNLTYNPYATTWYNALRSYEEDLPSGSGIDSGTTIDDDNTTDDTIVLNVPCHHMRDGYYRGWWMYSVTVTPTFMGISVGVECLDAPEECEESDDEDTDDYPDIVDACAIESTCEYLSELYHDALCCEIERYREDN